MLIQTQQICFGLLIINTGKERVPTFTFVMNKPINIYIYFKSVLKINFLYSNGVWKINELIAAEHYICLHIMDNSSCFDFKVNQ